MFLISALSISAKVIATGREQFGREAKFEASTDYTCEGVVLPSAARPLCCCSTTLSYGSSRRCDPVYPPASLIFLELTSSASSFFCAPAISPHTVCGCKADHCVATTRRALTCHEQGCANPTRRRHHRTYYQPARPRWLASPVCPDLIYGRHRSASSLCSDLGFRHTQRNSHEPVDQGSRLCVPSSAYCYPR